VGVELGGMGGGEGSGGEEGEECVVAWVEGRRSEGGGGG